MHDSNHRSLKTTDESQLKTKSRQLTRKPIETKDQTSKPQNKSVMTQGSRSTPSPMTARSRKQTQCNGGWGIESARKIIEFWVIHGPCSCRWYNCVLWQKYGGTTTINALNLNWSSLCTLLVCFAFSDLQPRLCYSDFEVKYRYNFFFSFFIIQSIRFDIHVRVLDP